MRDYKTPIFTPKSRFSYKWLLIAVLLLVVASLSFLDLDTPRQTQTTHTETLPIPGIPDHERAVLKSDQPKQNHPQKSTQPEKKPLQTTIPTPQTAATAPTISATWETHTVIAGDSLSNIFKEWQLPASLLHALVNSSPEARQLANLHPGQKLKLLRGDNKDELLKLMVIKSPTESLEISHESDSFVTRTILREVEVRHAFSQGTITNSLFLDGQKAGLTDAQIMEMAAIFGWDIDFALEIRQGDSFRVLYEEHYLDGKKFRNGPILAAEFRNNRKIYKAVRYTTPDGESGYYDPDDGRNKKRAFIRTPVKFARISSRFSGRRYHPKLKKWRAHRGVDYAAPTGTPVKAAGKGKVIFRGKKGGYGNVIFIQHGSKYTTVYAHLSKFARASRKGRKVTQGQIIGYVGQSGLATGPHLHYEFRVNGTHRNPLTVKLPKADPINRKYRDDFKSKTTPLMQELDRHSSAPQTGTPS